VGLAGEVLYSYAEEGGRRVDEEERGRVLDCAVADMIARAAGLGQGD
jgi:hypothetical protein